MRPKVLRLPSCSPRISIFCSPNISQSRQRISLTALRDTGSGLTIMRSISPPRFVSSTREPYRYTIAFGRNCLTVSRMLCCSKVVSRISLKSYLEQKCFIFMIRPAKPEDAEAIASLIIRSIREVCGPDYGNDEELLSFWCKNKTAENMRRGIQDPNNYWIVPAEGHIVV